MDEILSSVQKSASGSPEEVLQLQTEFKKQREQVAKKNAKLAELSAKDIAEYESEEAKDNELNKNNSLNEHPRRDAINDELIASADESLAVLQLVMLLITTVLLLQLLMI